MNAKQFEAVTRRAATAISRRGLLGGLAGGWLALGGTRLLGTTAAKNRKRTQRNDKATPNAFSCLNVGDPCRRDDQCCSDVCRGRKGKKRCRAHDVQGCPANAGFLAVDECRAENIPCTTATGAPGSCATTTGNAGYCAGGGDCRPCTKDADCQALCGPRAACIPCPSGGCDITGTACYGPDGVVCPL